MTPATTIAAGAGTRGRRELIRDAAVWTATAALLGSAGWRLASSRSEVRGINPIAQAQDARAELSATRDQRFAALRMLDAADPAAVGGLLRSSLHDPHRLLTEQSRAALFDALGAHIAARSSRDFNDYLRQAEREGTRWLGPDDPDEAWRLPLDYHSKIFGAVPPRTSGRDVCGALLAHLWARGARLAAVGEGPWGMRIEIGRTRNPAAPRSELVFADPEIEAYWTAASGIAGAAYRVPRRTLERVVAERGSATFAMVAAACRAENKHGYLWVSAWYWDPTEAAWRCAESRMLVHGAHTMYF